MSFCCLEYEVSGHLLIQYLQQHIVSAFKYLHCHMCVDCYRPPIIEGNSSTRAGWKHCKLLKSAVQVYVINMKTMCSVAGINSISYCIPDRITLLLMVTWQGNLTDMQSKPQVGELVVLPMTSEHVLFMCYHNVLVVKSFLLQSGKSRQRHGDSTKLRSPVFNIGVQGRLPSKVIKETQH